MVLAKCEEFNSKFDLLICDSFGLLSILSVSRMRLNFLTYLETWSEQAKERAASVVVAKCEELNSELDLRLHLHQPRSRRAELDVHNVRAGLFYYILCLVIENLVQFGILLPDFYQPYFC